MRLSQVGDENLRFELLGILKKFAYEKREVVLSSGQKSNFYIDCKQASFRGDGAYALGRLFFEAMQQHERDVDVHYDACGGMALGSVPLSLALTLQAFSFNRDLPSVCVRKETKEHGTRNAVEGASHLARGSKVLLVEDVVTTGQATLRAAKALRDAGFAIDFVIAIVDRQSGGEAALGSEGIKLRSLFDLSDFHGAI